MVISQGKPPLTTTEEDQRGEGGKYVEGLRQAGELGRMEELAGAGEGLTGMTIMNEVTEQGSMLTTKVTGPESTGERVLERTFYTPPQEAMEEAMGAGNWQVARLLVGKADVDVNAHAWPNKDITPLWHAAKAGNVEMVRLLADRGVRIDESRAARLALTAAAEEGRTEGVRCVIIEKVCR